MDGIPEAVLRVVRAERSYRVALLGVRALHDSMAVVDGAEMDSTYTRLADSIIERDAAVGALSSVVVAEEAANA